MKVYSRYTSITYTRDLKVIKTQIHRRIGKNIVNVKCSKDKSNITIRYITTWYPFRRLCTSFKYLEKDNINDDILGNQFLECIIKHIPHIILSTKINRGKSYIAVFENNVPIKSNGSLYSISISVIKTKQFEAFSDAIYGYRI